VGLEEGGTGLSRSGKKAHDGPKGMAELNHLGMFTTEHLSQKRQHS
jgi:hypothetical protein